MNESTSGAPFDSVQRQRRLDRRVRLLVLAALFVGLLIAGRASGATQYLDPTGVRTLVARAGVWGKLAFVAAFAAGQLLHVPGMVFVGAGVLAFGRLAGFAWGLLGALVSACVSFLVVRTLGGSPLAEFEHPWARRTLMHIELHPVRTVVLLRSVMWMAPALNYALGMSGLRFRDYLTGSAIGLLLPIAAMAWFFGLLR